MSQAFSVQSIVVIERCDCLNDSIQTQVVSDKDLNEKLDLRYLYEGAVCACKLFFFSR